MSRLSWKIAPLLLVYLALLICGCSSGTNNQADSGSDSSLDGADGDAAGDLGTDTGADADLDAGIDAGVDAGADAGDSGGDSGPQVLSYQVVVVGAGTGGVAAALQAARSGAEVALLEETDWIGGQMTAAGVSTMDEGGFNTDAGIYAEFIRRVVEHYLPLGKTPEKCGLGGTGRCTEASVAQQILREMLSAEPRVTLYTRTRVEAVRSTDLGGHQAVIGVEASRATAAGREALRFVAQLVIDATEYGDAIAMSPARFRAGNSTSDAIRTGACVQDNTYTAVVGRYPNAPPAELIQTVPPPGYDSTVEAKFAGYITTDGDDWRVTGHWWTGYPINWLVHVAYRQVPNSLDPVNYVYPTFEDISKTGVNMANDFPYTVAELVDRSARRTRHCQAKLFTLQFLYYMQVKLGETRWAIADDEGYDSAYNLEENLCPEIPDALKPIERHFPLMPYVRESIRLIGLHTLTAGEIRRMGSPSRAVTPFPTAVAVGDYPVDLHGCNTDPDLEADLESSSDVPHPTAVGPFQIPFEVFIPESVDGLLPAEKNLSLSRLAAGACRLQPVTMHTGQAAGAIAALAVQRGIQPRALDPVPVQWELLKAGARLSMYKFSDVPLGDPAWREVELCSAHGLFVGYPDGRFGIGDPLARAAAAVVLAKLFALQVDPPPVTPTFSDVPADHWAFKYIEAVYAAGITAGCGSNPLRFCPDDPASRAQLAVFLIRGLGLDPATAPPVPLFADVPAGHWAFGFVQLAGQLGFMDPCSTGPDAFCPDAAVTRVDTARAAARVLLYQHP